LYKFIAFSNDCVARYKEYSFSLVIKKIFLCFKICDKLTKVFLDYRGQKNCFNKFLFKRKKRKKQKNLENDVISRLEKLGNYINRKLSSCRSFFSSQLSFFF